MPLSFGPKAGSFGPAPSQPKGGRAASLEPCPAPGRWQQGPTSLSLGHPPSTTLRARGAETRTWETTLRLQSLLYGGPWLRVAARVAPEPFHQPKNEARDPPRGKAQARPCHSRSGSKKGQLLSLLFLPIQQIKNAAQRKISYSETDARV